MDYKETAAQIRNGPADIPLITKVLADLLEDLESTPTETTQSHMTFPQTETPAKEDVTLTDTEVKEPNASVVPTTVIG